METKMKRFENLAEGDYEARKEAEDFLNRWFDDSTKGWGVRMDFLNSYEYHFVAPPDMCPN